MTLFIDFFFLFLFFLQFFQLFIIYTRYYALGHFSRFILPGSIRIFVNSTSTHSTFEPPMEVCGFLRPDGLIVMVVLNRDHASLSVDTKYDVVLKDGRRLSMDVPANSFATIVFSTAK